VRCPQAPQAKQQQKKRTFDVLQNADSFTRYGQAVFSDAATISPSAATSGPTATTVSGARKREN
jgi:hypothetical protein